MSELIQQMHNCAPSVSVIVPVYNVEPYLAACLDSILNQTYTNFELILVDDGSTDNSGAICDEYAKKHDFIRVFHQTNQGQSAARNFGVEKALADWIMFVDSDDVIHPDLLKYMVNAVEETGAKVCTCPRVEQVEIPDDFIRQREAGYSVYTIDEDQLIGFYVNKCHAYWALFPSLISTSIVRAYPFTQGRIYEDNALSCRWLYAAGKVTILKEAMYFYRTNLNGTMNQTFSTKKFDYLWALQQQLEFYEGLGYTRIFNMIVKEYVGTTTWMCDRIEENLHDKAVEKAVLRDSIRTCKRYKAKIDEYPIHIQKLRKRLHPGWYRINKAVNNHLKSRT